MLSAEGTGKTIEKAIENALLDLKAVREDVDIKILNEGGLFKKAKVLVTISKDCESKYEKHKAFKAEEDKIADEEKTSIQGELPKVVEELVEPKKTDALTEKPEKTTKQVKTEKTENKKLEEKKIDRADKDEDEKEHKFAGKIIEPKIFLEGYFKALEKEVTIDESQEDNFIIYSVHGSELGEVIGHRGEAFYALNTLVQTLAGRSEKRVLIDVDDYRARRNESLTATAKRMATKVSKTGRYMKLEPMNPAERRIIHTALQDDDRVTTLSKGSEPNRFVIIFPKEYKERD